jgi:hypothetical protein
MSDEKPLDVIVDGLREREAIPKEPLTQVFVRSDGSEVLVTVYRERPTPIIEVAERERTGDVWGPPLRERP